MTLNKHCPCGCFNSFENQKNDFIKEFDHWILYLHFRQYFFGRCLVILKNHKTKVSELTNDEMAEFIYIYKKWDKAVSKLSAGKNYNTVIMISNTEHDIHNSHLHWHFIPRYNENIYFADNLFVADSRKQKNLPYNKIEKKEITAPKLRGKIAGAIRKFL